MGGFKECAECERFKTCDRKPWIHRHEKDCNYGIINGN